MITHTGIELKFGTHKGLIKAILVGIRQRFTEFMINFLHIKGQRSVTPTG